MICDMRPRGGKGKKETGWIRWREGTGREGLRMHTVSAFTFTYHSSGGSCSGGSSIIVAV